VLPLTWEKLHKMSKSDSDDVEPAFMVVVTEEQADEAAAERNENCDDDDDEVGVVEATPRPCGSLATEGALILVIGVIYGIMYV